MNVEWIRVPIMKELTLQNVWEHTPLDYYRYSEYPRFIRPIGHERPQWKWERRDIFQCRECR